MQGYLHPSLRAYIDCFLSSPFPKQFPRAGGIWDQDPLLMRDFRFIRDFEVQWKQTQEQLKNLRGQTDPTEVQEGGSDLEDALDEYIKNLEEEDTF